MRRPTIFLDMDGVLCNFVDPSLKAAGIDLTHEEITKYNYWELADMTADEFWQKINWSQDFWLSLPPYPWAHELFMRLSRVGDIVILTKVTARALPSTAGWKLEWLHQHGFMDAGRLTSGVRYLAGDAPKELLAGTPRSVLIDDCADNIRHWADAVGEATPLAGIGRPENRRGAITFPQPWNIGGETVLKTFADTRHAGRIDYVMCELREELKVRK